MAEDSFEVCLVCTHCLPSVHSFVKIKVFLVEAFAGILMWYNDYSTLYKYQIYCTLGWEY